MTTRAMPNPSCRDSEKRPSRLTVGVPVTVGAPVTASVIASVLRVGSGGFVCRPWCPLGLANRREH